MNGTVPRRALTVNSLAGGATTAARAAFMPLLMILMIIKFVMVVLEFMHLRKDAKLFHYLFWSGFLLAIGVYIVALATFKFFLKA